jgi:hypothetical protein
MLDQLFTFFSLIFPNLKKKKNNQKIIILMMKKLMRKKMKSNLKIKLQLIMIKNWLLKIW